MNTNWDSLFDGLKSKQYQAVLSSLYPYNFNQELYNFSDPFLEIGPVLVLPLQAPKLSLKDLSGKAVGILEGSPDVLLLEKDPSILIRNYISAPVALNALVSGEIEAALIPILTASSYVDHIYFKKLKIGSPPLTDEGLRLITLKGDNVQLIEKFNQALHSLKKNGELEKLLLKWNISN